VFGVLGVFGCWVGGLATIVAHMAVPLLTK